MLDRLVEHLKREEGFVPHVYKDHLGYDTLGYGFLVDEKKGGRIPEQIAEEWLHLIAMQYWCALTAKHTWLLEQPEDVQIAIGSMAYQMGVKGVLGFEDMLGALKRGDREAAADFGLDSDWAREDTPARAKRVTDLIRGTPNLP